MYKLYQLHEDDCFAVAVACIVEMSRPQLPDHKPTVLPSDLYRVWAEWARDTGHRFIYTVEDPGGLCVASVEVGEMPERYKDKYAGLIPAHSVVWHNGVVWDPQGYTPELYRTVHNYVTIERM